ncbi:MAG TPA: hypothetical protein VN843_09810 [Anaerolineales bacterium]|nr:hypothetical protein [Anaerolineales bacterium]
MTLVVGFGSKARHGKDTAGEAVRDYYERHAKLFHKHGQIGSKFITAKIYKWADALYAEVNNAIAVAGGIEALRTRGVVFADGFRYVLPKWVLDAPTLPKSSAAPHGKWGALLQWWGTDLRRVEFGENYWVDKTVAQIKKENPDVALITDTRFPNEAQAVKDLGGYTFNVTRLNADGSLFIAPDRPANHVSETALDGWAWDLKIVNSDGHAALTGELAITYVEYLRGLHGES